MTALTYPAVGISGAASGITHAARHDAETTVDGWAVSYCGRWVSVDHRLDGAPLRATAAVMPELDDDGVIGQPIDCLTCRRGIERYDAESYDPTEVTCERCGTVKADAMTCEICGVTGCECAVDVVRLDCGGDGDGMTLCSEHAPRHNGCPHCDPDYRRDLAMDR